MRETDLRVAEDLCVVICTYNRSRLLDKALEALGQQAVAPEAVWSVIVVDNNCTDDTRDVVAAHLATGRIPSLAIVGESEQGLAASRRRGVIEADATWIAFIDDDVMVGPGWVQAALDFVQRTPGVGVFCGRIDLHWEETPPPALAVECKVGYAAFDCGVETRQFRPKGLVHMVGAAMVLRRRAIFETGWIDHAFLTDRVGRALTSGGDMELATRIAHAGYERWYCPDMVARHIIPADRTTLRYICKLSYGMARSSAQLCELGLGRPPGLRWRMRRFIGNLRYLCRRACGLFLHDWLVGRRGGIRQVQIYEAWGRINSSWDLLTRAYVGLWKSRGLQLLSLGRELGWSNAIRWSMRSRRAGALVRFELSGYRHPIYVRPSGSDLTVVRQVRAQGVFELEVPPGGLVIDAGANIGFVTAALATRHPEALILAVEPDEDNCRMFELNCGDYPNVRLVRGAIWPRRSRLTFGNPGAASWELAVKELDDGERASCETRGVPVSDLLEMAGATAIILLKVDIEGAERELFDNGAEEWLDRVGTLVIELHDRWVPGCTDALERAVAGRGFTRSKHGECQVFEFGS